MSVAWKFVTSDQHVNLNWSLYTKIGKEENNDQFEEHEYSNNEFLIFMMF